MIRFPASWKVEMGPCNGWVYQYYNNQTQNIESFFTKALFQVRSLVRNVRSAEPGQGDKKGKKGKGKGKGKKGKGRKAKKGKGDKKGKKNGNTKNGARKRGNTGKGKEGNKKKGGKGNKGRNNQKKGRSDKKNGKKGGKKNEKKGDKTKKNDNNSSKKKGRSGKDSKLLPEFLYNQLWCFDLAMEQVFKPFDNNLVVFMPDIWQHISDVFLIVDNVCRL